MRQDHGRAADRGAGETVGWIDRARRTGSRIVALAGATAAGAAGADDVPGLLRVDGPPDAGGDDPARADDHPARREPVRADQARLGDAGRGGTAGRRGRAVPARVLRRAAAAARAGPGADAAAVDDRGRRAGVRPRRLDPGADPQPDARSPARAPPAVPVLPAPLVSR